MWGFAGVAVVVLCGPHGALAPGATTIAAGIYELTPLKRYFRRRCRDSAASGLDVGFDCVGSCLGLMLAAMALGVTSAAGMSVVALLVGAQKLLPVKATVDVPLALAIVGLGLLVVIAPSSVPALTERGSDTPERWTRHDRTPDRLRAGVGGRPPAAARARRRS